MTQKAVVQITKEIDGKTFTFTMDLNSPYGACYDALHEMLGEVVKMAKDAKDRLKRDEKVAEKEEEVKEDK